MRDTIEQARSELLASYYRAKAAVEARSVTADNVEFARLVAAALAARERLSTAP